MKNDETTLVYSSDGKPNQKFRYRNIPDSIWVLESLEFHKKSLRENDDEIVLVGDETGEFGSRITVIPKAWTIEISTLKKVKK